MFGIALVFLFFPRLASPCFCWCRIGFDCIALSLLVVPSLLLYCLASSCIALIGLVWPCLVSLDVVFGFFFFIWLGIALHRRPLPRYSHLRFSCILPSYNVLFYALVASLQVEAFSNRVSSRLLSSSIALPFVLVWDEYVTLRLEKLSVAGVGER